MDAAKVAMEGVQDGDGLYGGGMGGILDGDAGAVAVVLRFSVGTPPAPRIPPWRVSPRSNAYCISAGQALRQQSRKSANRAERFLADPEIEHLRTEAARRFRLLVASASAQWTDKGLAESIGRDVSFWGTLLVTRPGAMFVSRWSPDPVPGQAHGGFVLNVGQARQRMAALLKQYYLYAKQQVEETQEGRHTEYRLRDKSIAKVRWALRNAYLIVTLGDESARERLPADAKKCRARLAEGDREGFADQAPDRRIEASTANCCWPRLPPPATQTPRKRSSG